MDQDAAIAVAQFGVDKVPNEIAILDSAGEILVVNEAWRRFADENHGTHPDHWIGENYFEIVRRSDDAVSRVGLVAALNEVLEGTSESYRYEYPCHSPDEQRWFRLDAAGFRYDGRPHLLVSHTDITEEKLAEIRANARSEQLQTVVDVLTHDIRNPLNVLDGYLQVLAEELDDSETIETLEQAVTRITEITEATFEFSKASALDDVEPLSVEELAHTAWGTVATGAATLDTVDSRRIIGDRRLLLQLFENLFRNAVEHAGPACAVRVGALPEGFYIEDDGPGIPESLRAKVLTADYSTRGTGGLGLAIVQAVARAHGGTLTVTESATGGARFELAGFDVPPDPDGQTG